MARDTVGRFADRVADRGWVVAAVLTESMLDELAATAIGEGIAGPTVRHTFNLPVLGPAETELSVTITGVTFALRAGDGGRRLRATLHGRGRVRFMQITSAPVPPDLAVRAEVLVDPILHLGDDLVFGLDVGSSELVDITLRPATTAADDTSSPGAQMGQIISAMLGEEAYALLRREMGKLTVSLGPDAATLALTAGLRAGDAEVVVGDGRLTFGLLPFDPDDATGGGVVARVGDSTGLAVSVAASALGPAVARLAERALDGLPVPFELDVRAAGALLSGRLRNSRLLPETWPDLRPSLAWEVGARLRDGAIELAIRAAWLELPELLPLPVNRWSRQLGGVAGLLPPLARIPISFRLPVAPVGAAAAAVRVESLELSEGQLDLELAQT